MSLVKYFIRRLLTFDFICRIFFDRTFHSMPLSYAFKQRRSLNIFPWMVYNFPLLQASNRLHLRWAMVSLFRDPHGTFSTHLNQFKVISELNQTTPPNHREGTWGPGSIACLHSSSSLAIFNGWFELYESVNIMASINFPSNIHVIVTALWAVTLFPPRVERKAASYNGSSWNITGGQRRLVCSIWLSIVPF